LSFADAERRFTDELIAEVEQLKAKQPPQASAGPVPVKVNDPKAVLTYEQAQAEYAKITDPKARAEYRVAHATELRLK
jgi:hypothetical protein